MDGYSYLHNLRILDQATYSERSGRPYLTCDGYRLETPIFDNITPCITRRIFSILKEMVIRMKECQKKNPWLFHISQMKEETPESIKIRKIFVWAGIDTSKTGAINFIGLYQRAPRVPNDLEKLTGFELSKQLALRNEKIWGDFELKCSQEDFLLCLRSSPEVKYLQIFRAYIVAAAWPYGIESYRALKEFIPDIDKTTLLLMLIYKNGKRLGAQKDNPDLLAFCEEWQKLQPTRDPEVTEHALSIYQGVTHIDIEKRVAGCIKNDNGFMECFCAIFSMGNYKEGEVVYRSLGKMSRPALVEAPILYEDQFWLSLVQLRSIPNKIHL